MVSNFHLDRHELSQVFEFAVQLLYLLPPGLLSATLSNTIAHFCLSSAFQKLLQEQHPPPPLLIFLVIKSSFKLYQGV